jgi:hypothetical protein
LAAASVWHSPWLKTWPLIVTTVRSSPVSGWDRRLQKSETEMLASRGVKLSSGSRGGVLAHRGRDQRVAAVVRVEGQVRVVARGTGRARGHGAAVVPGPRAGGREDGDRGDRRGGRGHRLPAPACADPAADAGQPLGGHGGSGLVGAGLQLGREVGEVYRPRILRT